uniref:4-hydroxyphenylpyruvate dioxygenase n=1 Tax=Populus trichocarpa TaxID=3694 RepID=B9H843_POPTR
MGKENETSETPGEFKLVGFSNFVRTNSRSDLFKVNRFHHVEFWCSDATNTARPSMDVNLSHTATASIPTFNHETCRNFSAKHGLAVRAIAIEVDDAELAFTTSVAHGAKPSASPILLDNGAVITESPDNWFLPKFEAVSSFPLDYGIRRLDHAVGNVPELAPALNYDVGTSESGLNAVVLANNEETVLLPMNEPVFGTKRKSQIQTYLEHNEGAGVQHLPLVSEDIFRTLREMRKCSAVEGFEAGDVLSDEQIK